MTTIKEAVEDLFNNPQLSVQEVVDRHYIPAFRQRTNGSWDDRAALVARIDECRKPGRARHGHRAGRAHRLGAVAVELDLSVGADVEGAVPTVSDEAIADR